jgi:hypothetical protein
MPSESPPILNHVELSKSTLIIAEIAQILGSVITDYNIEDKIVAFQMDNASNNDTALTALMSK